MWISRCDIVCCCYTVVIQELEEKLFVATKEKENLEDVLQDKHSEVNNAQIQH